MTISINGGTGDADSYTSKTGQPSTNSHTCRSYKNGNNETCPVQLSAGEAV